MNYASEAARAAMTHKQLDQQDKKNNMLLNLPGNPNLRKILILNPDASRRTIR